MQHNGSLYAVSYVRSDASLVGPSKTGSFSSPASVATLSRYFPQRKIRAVKNLLSSSGEQLESEEEVQPEGEEEVKEVPIISYYHPNLTLALINEPKAIVSPNALPPPVAAGALHSIVVWGKVKTDRLSILKIHSLHIYAI